MFGKEHSAWRSVERLAFGTYFSARVTGRLAFGEGSTPSDIWRLERDLAPLYLLGHRSILQLNEVRRRKYSLTKIIQDIKNLCNRKRTASMVLPIRAVEA